MKAEEAALLSKQFAKTKAERNWETGREALFTHIKTEAEHGKTSIYFQDGTPFGVLFLVDNQCRQKFQLEMRNLGYDVRLSKGTGYDDRDSYYISW